MLKLGKSISSKMPVYFPITKYLVLGRLEARKGCLHLGWGGFQLCHNMLGRDKEATATEGACEEARKQGSEGVEEAGLTHFIQTHVKET